MPAADVALLVKCDPGILLEEPRRVKTMLRRLCKKEGIKDLNKALQDNPT